MVKKEKNLIRKRSVWIYPAIFFFFRQSQHRFCWQWKIVQIFKSEKQAQHYRPIFPYFSLFQEKYKRFLLYLLISETLIFQTYSSELNSILLNNLRWRKHFWYNQEFKRSITVNFDEGRYLYFLIFLILICYFYIFWFFHWNFICA